MAIELKDIANSLASTNFKFDEPALLVGQFEKDPFAAYKVLLERVYSYKQFSESQDFLAIILEEITITDPDNLADWVVSATRSFKNYNQNYSFWKIAIPVLDAAVPLDFVGSNEAVKTRIDTFFSDISRVAVCEDPSVKGSIKKGSIVRVSDAIIAAKNREPCVINTVITAQSVDIETSTNTLNDAFKACIATKLAINPPPEPVATRPASAGAASATSIDVSIYSKLNKNQKSPRNIFVLSTPPSAPTADADPGRESREKRIEVSNVMPTADDLQAFCELGPVQSVVSKQKTSDEKINENCFVRNGKTLVETQSIGKIGKASFFNSLSKKNNLVVPASQDLDSTGPIYEYPEDLREPSMVVIKTVQYTYVEDYYAKILSDKVPAAHFCIDLNGSIYQFTDTKNLVRSYNPMIDEKSIYIAVVNIPFRNSLTTLAKLQDRSLLNLPSSTRRDFTFSNLGKAAELANSISLDEWKLKRFYSYKFDKYTQETKNSLKKITIPKKQVIISRAGTGQEILEDTFTLSDRRDTFPAYRLDYTEPQKISLRALTSAICKSYNLFASNKKKSVPTTYGFDLEVASGDFKGIVSPMHFTFSEMEPLNFYDLVYDILL